MTTPLSVAVKMAILTIGLIFDVIVTQGESVFNIVKIGKAAIIVIIVALAGIMF